MFLLRLKEKLRILLRTVLSRYRRKVYLISSDNYWSLHWDAHYISKTISEKRNIAINVKEDGLGYKNQILHFCNRHNYLKGQYRYIDKSNINILTWFHGKWNDENKNLKDIFRKLVELEQSIDKIVVSSTIAEERLMANGIGRNKIVRIPIGVDLRIFFKKPIDEIKDIRNRFNIPVQKVVIGLFQKDGVGMLKGMKPKLEKGPDVFLKTVEIIKSKYENIFVFLTGPARGYIISGLERLGVEYKHIYMNNYWDIADCYQVCDLYIIPSRDEGGPKALMESWATGVPLVSTRVGMPADYIRDGENGFLVEVEDYEALAEKALQLIEDKALRDKLIGNGLEDVKQLDWKVIGEQYYEKLYKPYLDRH